MDAAEDIYRLTDRFPKEELYGLTSQLRRAAVSIPSNIAEGQSRKSTAEFIQFISIAQGSRAEAETQLLLAKRLQYADTESIQKILNDLYEIYKMLYHLRASLT
jgi:four helix bundle protein